jgi:succinate-semialdehyde dehydrogenase/glutarate-semialdehyde dehydrogenase
VQSTVVNEFLTALAQAAEQTVVGNGLDESSMVGPMANARRITAMEEIVRDAKERGARVCAGGERGHDQRGYYWRPTILTDLPADAQIMRSEPFGPIAAVTPFSDIDDALAAANQLPYGLAAYAFTNSVERRRAIAVQLECGVLGINSFAINLPETPFGGVKDSGYGSEGGAEGLSAYIVPKFVVEGQQV